MDRNSQAKEVEAKRAIAINDFELLREQGKIAFYNSCEVTQVFLIENDTGKVINYFTLACFSEKIPKAKGRYLTKSPMTINNEFKLGILQCYVSLDDASALFDAILTGTLAIRNCSSQISENFILLPKQFVPQIWGGVNPALNNILKPNYYGDNYIIEFFDEKKDVLNYLKRSDVDLIHRQLADCADISIDMSAVYERIGGIVFQFPVTILSSDCNILENWTEAKVEVNRHPKLKKDIELIVTLKTFLDETVTGFNTVTCSSNDRCFTVPVGDSENLEFSIIDKDSSLLLKHCLLNFLRKIGVDVRVSSSHAQPRELHSSDHADNVSLQLSSRRPIEFGGRKNKEYREHILRRLSHKDVTAHSGDYIVLKQNDRKRALSFIRKKLTAFGKISEICLWDPYLDIQDIVDTLYYEPTGISFRCVTSKKGLKKKPSDGKESDTEEGQSFESIKYQQRQRLDKLSNSLGVKLDFRCQYGNFGYPFHDRFLILVPSEQEELPTVYSLGSSVNSLGNQHHIIQKITNPRMILDDFNKIWRELPEESCRILKLPDDLE